MLLMNVLRTLANIRMTKHESGRTTVALAVARGKNADDDGGSRRRIQ